MLPGIKGTFGRVDMRLKEPNGSSQGFWDQEMREEQHEAGSALPAGCPQPTKCEHQKQAQSRLCLETGPHGTLQPGEGQAGS